MASINVPEFMPDVKVVVGGITIEADTVMLIGCLYKHCFKEAANKKILGEFCQSLSNDLQDLALYIKARLEEGYFL